MEIYASYEFKIEGSTTNIKARIADSPRLLNTFLSELRNLILSDQNVANNNNPPENCKPKKPVVVGLAVMPVIINEYRKVSVVQLCFGTYCVIIQLLQLGKEIQPLKTFLADEDIVFVGVCIRRGLAKLGSDHGLECSYVIELGTLADRIYGQKSKFFGYKIEELALELLGLKIETPTIQNHPQINWEIRDLTNEQIEYATSNAYASYCIGDKLLNGVVTLLGTNY